ncbi:hypothetical protein [Endozoicomonas numazuensis]|uniref:Uncharacterized protein n=1 Tax=Endozoicomonas numazuensis TaxID=1137799 RepID=A0A081NKZ1_9GAMM|nr:hypothetical protein [Endozoicomonas numazuensis]KEQ19114.1 hypothetical protein GZ78_03665 [Endozoicomonas numazuensis]
MAVGNDKDSSSLWGWVSGTRETLKSKVAEALGYSWGSSITTPDAEIIPYIQQKKVAFHKPIHVRYIENIHSLSYTELRDQLIQALQEQHEPANAGDQIDRIRRGVIDICIANLATDDHDKLLRNWANFEHLMPGFPKDLLLSKWYQEQNKDPLESLTPALPDLINIWDPKLIPEASVEDLDDVMRVFESLFEKYKKDDNEDHPDTRVFTVRWAYDFMRHNRLDLFLDLYRNSRWLQQVLPKSCILAIQKSLAGNKITDIYIGLAKKDLDRTQRDVVDDKTISFRRAAMLQKSSHQYNSAIAGLREALKANRTKEYGASEADLPQYQARKKQLESIRELLAAGQWKKAHVEAQKDEELFTEIGEMTADMTERDAFQLAGMYVPQVLHARLLIAYQSCLAKGNTDEFFQFFRPDPCSYNHWTCVLERSEFENLKDQIQEALSTRLNEDRKVVSRTPDEIEQELDRFEEGLQKFMLNKFEE